MWLKTCSVTQKNHHANAHNVIIVHKVHPTQFPNVTFVHKCHPFPLPNVSLVNKYHPTLFTNVTSFELNCGFDKHECFKRLKKVKLEHDISHRPLNPIVVEGPPLLCHETFGRFLDDMQNITFS